MKFKEYPYFKSYRVENSLPKQSDSTVAHILPHSRKGAYLINGEQIGNLSDADELSNGEFMTKQCIWFNRGYIAKQIESALRESGEI